MSNSKSVERELASQSHELSSDELERVSGGNGSNQQRELVRKQQQLRAQQENLNQT
jgi:hypothetical protein